jgi:hypothetical protein
MAARLNTIVAIAMLALYDEYDEFDTYWQNGGYKKISDIIFAECHIFIVSNLWCQCDDSIPGSFARAVENLGTSLSNRAHRENSFRHMPPETNTV